jgi:hypothetical protein
VKNLLISVLLVQAMHCNPTDPSSGNNMPRIDILHLVNNHVQGRVFEPHSSVVGALLIQLVVFGMP